MQRFVFFIVVFILSSFHLQAQVEPPTIMPGLSGVYSSELETLGWNARLYYATDHHFCFGPEVSFFKRDIEEGEITFFEANANLHYILDLGGGLGFYPLSGFNYSVETETENITSFQEENVERAFGLNVGAGFHYAKGRLLFFTEYKYVISDLDDHFFTLGCLINFSLSHKNKNTQHHQSK
ncbi:outer membrane beta-barrel protein [Flagellimonas meridianipacifica]|uniref:Outer membrane protein with beta-barrel domain n=1 Tax=Flagellimonas meridianipacifica TaxID=1080225 RepID=A0A2T0MK09_9FLAO|nr:outer membrane beta-barrel protein [Allomuricauda pacifica]PRX57917.1 outer membrane protein with beta-barrel domain [Allomuricauda pacifica]